MSYVVYSFWTQRLLKVILLVALSLGAKWSVEAGQNVMLTWNPSTNSDVAGYNIYCGTKSRVYTNMIPVGNVTNTTIMNLAPGFTYYFAAKSHDSSTNQSGYSTETVFTVPKTVTNLPPTLRALANVSINRNSTLQSVTLTGIAPGTTSGHPLKITAISSNPNLINPAVYYTSPQNVGAVTFKPSVNSTGTVSITVTVDNGGASNNTVSQSFQISVVEPVTEAMIAALPKIYRQPESETVSPGKMVILTVGVSGRAPFQYQWQFNGTDVPGATSSFLILRNFNAAQAGAYSVQVSNAFGTTNSAAGILALPVAAASAVKLTATSLVPVNPAASLTTVPAGHGQFSFDVNGINGSNYVVQASTDLIKWTSMVTNASPFRYTETNSLAYAHRYYRTTYLP